MKDISGSAVRMAAVFATLLVFAATAGAAVEITAVDFKNEPGASTIEITGDGLVTFEKQENPDDKQIVIELKDAKLAGGVDRKLDTSSFDSKVSLVSPYQVDGTENTARVVIQLKDMVSADASIEGNTIKVVIPNAGAAAAPPPPPPPAQTEDQAAAPEQTPPAAPPAAPAPSVEAKTNLDTFTETKENKQFSGRPVTIQVKDADVQDVLRLIGEASGFNIVVGEEVKGKITLALVDVPWDQALDVILHTKQLAAERKNNVLRVVTLQGLTKEKQDELQAKQATEASAPRITRVFPVSYAKPSELKTILSQFGKTGSNDVMGQKSQSVIQVDERTNSIIVMDIPENIERMRKMIELLDTQTPQVMIEAKIIEATEGFSRAIGGSIGFGNAELNKTNFIASLGGANPIDALIGTPGVFADGNAVSTAAQGAGGTFGLSPKLSFLPGIQRLNALLSIGESENRVKIVSSPKTVVLNKGSATIVQGTPVLVPGTTFIEGVGQVPTTSVMSANLSMTVKPTVTNDGSILLDLNVSRDIPVPLSGGSSGIGSRNMNTTVVVESGSTLMIGGIYTTTSTSTSSGFPFLRKIPIIGWLFGKESENNDRSELFIIISPRILNEKEAGITAG
ncbi:MAG: hypothetical protein A2583_09675 [Bdellovibrionales bacterium RIFOXYD1_FULL_53_11]|nr:MAG: hypothetical protein A2583_09675 [Bdellovibrionales bacterium RIFOXYD1_FULL_53_11]